MTPKQKLMLHVARSAENATGAIDALISDLNEQKAQVALWAEGKPAREPRVYGNRLGAAADAVGEFRATIRTTHYALELFEQEN